MLRVTVLMTLVMSVLCLVVSVTGGQVMKPDFGLLTDEEIHYINNIQTSWKVNLPT